MLALMAGCANTTGDGQEGAKPTEVAASRYTLRIVVNDGVTKRPLAVGPRKFTEPAKTSAPAPGASGKALGTVAHALSNISMTGNLSSTDVLLWGAAVQCGMKAASSGGSNCWYNQNQVWECSEPPPPPPSGAPGRRADMSPVVPAWSTVAQGEAWYVFPSLPQSCDELVEDQETLLCMADRLKEVADAVTTVTWDKAEGLMPPFAGVGRGKWEFPLQSAEAKFVARDLAMEVLAHIGRLDAETFINGSNACAERYAYIAAHPESLTASASELFGVSVNETPVYPPSDLAVDSTNVVKLIKERLSLEGTVLRQAQRLLKDLVNDSVFADLAATEVRKNASFDSKAGNLAAFGLPSSAEPTNGEERYNSLAHAASVLSGRLDFGAGHTSCGGINGAAPDNLSLLKDNFGTDLDARVADVPVRSRSQASAVRLLEKGGLVVRSSTLASMTDADLRTRLVTTLVGMAAAQAGVATTEIAVTEASLQKAVAALSEGDLRFAYARNLRTFRTLTNQADNDAIDLTLANYGYTTAPGTTAFTGGIAMKGGLGRERLTTLSAVRFAGITKASSCFETSLTPANLGSPWIRDQDFPTSLPRRDKVPAYFMQNVSSVGHLFAQRLAVMRDVLALWPVTELNSVGKLATGAAVETRAWAGKGFVRLKASGSTRPTTVEVVAEIDKADLGLAASDSIATGLALAYGPPWVMECLQGTRTDCPEGLADKHVFRVMSSSSTVTDPTIRTAYGATSDLHLLTFDLTSLPSGAYTPRYEGDSAAKPDDRLYLIPQKRDASKPVQFVPLLVKQDKTTFATIPSSEVGRHIDAIAGERAGTSPGLYSSTLAESPSYCVDGAARDTFVPLENELTSDGDAFENSWKHYLTLAKGAAERADALAEKLVSLGTQMDMRREAAGETTAEICGAPPDLEGAKVFADGKVSAASSDASTASCLNAETVDVVFLNDDPTFGMTAADRHAYIKANVLTCPDVASGKLRDPLCDRPSTTPFTVATLGLAKAKTAKPAKACDVALDVAETFRTGSKPTPETLNKVLLEFDDGDLPRSIASGLRLVVDPNGHFELKSSGEIIVSSKTEKAWPKCLTGSGATACDTAATSRHAMLNRLFRVPCSGTSTLGALGSCETGTPEQKQKAELNQIRVRLEATLWKLGALGGTMPEGMIESFVPFANRSALPADSTLVPVVSVLYPVSDFTAAGLLNTSSIGYANAVGVTTAIDPEFYRGIGAGSLVNDELEQNFKDVVSNTGWFRHAATRSEAMRPDIGNALHFHGVFDDSSYPHHAVAGNSLEVLSRAMLATPSGSFPTTEPDELCKMAQLGFPEYALKAIIGPKWTTGEYQLGVNYNHSNCGASYGQYAYSKDQLDAVVPALRPEASGMPPARRVRFVTHGGGVAPSVEATRYARAVALGCIAATDTSSPLFSTDPPALSTVDDIPNLERWLDGVSENATTSLSKLAMVRMPKLVVDDFLKRSVSTSPRGAKGEKTLEIETEIWNLVSAWGQAIGETRQLKGAIAGARLKVKAAEIRESEERRKILIGQIQAIASAVQAYSNILSPGGTISAGAATYSSARTHALLEDSKTTAEDSKNNAVADAMNQLATSAGVSLTNIDRSVNTIRGATAKIMASTESVRRLEEKARYELAKGSGADYYKTADGKKVDLPVNTVLRRGYDITALRYQEALRQARYMAFLARRAIEQRIGIPLSGITKKVGTLAAPSEWADKVCSATGIDYMKLRKSPGSHDEDDKTIRELADQYIGDYVQKLEQFVEYYNVDFPSHEGDDSVVLSLKDDLLPRTTPCLGTAENRLLFAGSPHRLDTGAWVAHGCPTGETKCLQIFPKVALTNVAGAIAETSPTRGSWLVESTATGAGDPKIPGAPNNMVSQEVLLELGTYTLSWWDQARSTTGVIASAGSTPNYQVAIYDSDWKPLGASVFSDHAFVPTSVVAADTDVGTWSARRTRTITIDKPGRYFVGIKASNSSALGSVVVANFQLEAVAPSGFASSYLDTEGDRRTLVSSCKGGSSTELRSAFVRRCDKDGACFYELDRPLSINSGSFASPSSALYGRFAAGNFNYRHVSTAVNLVGTGLRSCGSTGTETCYGSGYLDYTLEHKANAVHILTWQDDRRVGAGTEGVYTFDFGTARIAHGKALAAERFLTWPLASADMGLLTTLGADKAELRGRPVDGQYTLRIYETPELRWERLQDVQVLVKYHYWSTVDRGAKP